MGRWGTYKIAGELLVPHDCFTNLNMSDAVHKILVCRTRLSSSFHSTS